MANPHVAAKDAIYGAMNYLRNGIMADIECAQLARVIKYDSAQHVADIQPLAKGFDGQDSAQYLDIPVSANCYIVDEVMDRFKPGEAWLNEHGVTLPKKHLMRKGAIVITVVLDNDSTNWDGSGNAYNPYTSRKHDANDAIVVGVLGDDIF